MNFVALREMMQEMDSLVSPAETHGMITGVVCAGAYMNGREWMDGVLGTLEIFERQHPIIQKLFDLYELISQQLKNGSLSLVGLLPETDQTVKSRAQSLSLWCQGFLFGLGLAGIKFEDMAHESMQEGLSNFSEISKLNYEDIEASEADAQALNEVYEYVCETVLRLYQEFNGYTDSGYEQAPMILH